MVVSSEKPWGLFDFSYEDTMPVGIFGAGRLQNLLSILMLYASIGALAEQR
jgi:hypothetical protein